MSFLDVNVIPEYKEFITSVSSLVVRNFLCVQSSHVPLRFLSVWHVFTKSDNRRTVIHVMTAVENQNIKNIKIFLYQTFRKPMFFRPLARIAIGQYGCSMVVQLLTTRFTDTQTLAGRLLQRAHICTQLAAGLETEAFGFRAQVANH